MNVEYLEAAREKISNIPVLINLISKRVRQLNAGQRPYVKPDSPRQPHIDIALKEVAEGAIEAELPQEDELGEDALLTL